MKSTLTVLFLLLSLQVAAASDFDYYSNGTDPSSYEGQVFLVNGHILKLSSVSVTVNPDQRDSNEFNKVVFRNTLPSLDFVSDNVYVFNFSALANIVYDPSTHIYTFDWIDIVASAATVAPVSGFKSCNYRSIHLFADVQRESGAPVTDFPFSADLAAIDLSVKNQSLLMYLDERVANMQPTVITQSISFLVGTFAAIAFVIASRMRF